MANTTLNPSDKTAGIALSGGNLVATTSGTAIQAARAVNSQVAGKLYWEFQINTVGGGSVAFGVANGTVPIANLGAAQGNSTGSIIYNASGGIYIDGTIANNAMNTIATGAWAGCAIDLGAQLVWFRQSAAGIWNNTGGANPATGSGGYGFTVVGGSIAAFPHMTVSSFAAGNVVTLNFGDSAFAGTVPSGYTAGWPTVPAGGGGGAAQAYAMVLA